MVKVGLIGLGYLGKIHLKLLREIKEVELLGVFDIDPVLTKTLADQYNTQAFTSAAELIEAADAIDIVTPSNTHCEIASQCIRKGKHVFIEKPATSTVEEAKLLQSLAKEAGVIIQVGHVERFNPAFVAAKPLISSPQYIEFQRLAQYNPRGTDVSVTLDLMIHDLDLLLTLVKSNIKKISANGVSSISKTPDIANARIEFDNGCVANVTANRIALDNSRKLTVYQDNTVIKIDLLNKITEVIRYKNAVKNSQGQVIIPGKGIPDKEISIEHPIILPTNAIKEELLAFHISIITAKKPVVTIDDAIDVLSLAYSIDEKILHLISK